MNKDDKNNKKEAEELSKLVQGQNKIVDGISSTIYGTKKTDNINDLKKNVSLIINDFKDDIGGDIISKLNNKNRNFSKEEQLRLNKLKDSLDNNNNVAQFQQLLTSINSSVAKYEDLMIMTKMMPKLKSAKNLMVNSIMSPDDFTKQLALSISLHGKALSNSDEGVLSTLNSEIKAITKKYNFTKEVKHIISSVLTLGRYYVAVLPYEKLYNDLLKSKTNRNKLNNKPIRFQENVTFEFIKESESIIKSTFENTTNDIKNELKSMYDNIEVYNEASSLFDESILLEAISKTAKSKNNINKEELLKIFNNVSNGVSKDGLLDSNKPYENQDLKLTGCKIKRLDPRRLIKISIDNTILKYYYFDDNKTVNMIKNPSFKFRSMITQDNANNGVDAIYKNLGELLYSKLDTSFIKNTVDVKEQLYDVLKYADAMNNPLKVISLDPDLVQEFEINDGESMFEQSIFYAKLYLPLLMSSLSAKIARSNDIRAYYVETDASGGVTSMVMNAINTLKKNNRSFYSMSSLGKVISNFSVFEDVYISKSQDTKPIDFDVIQGQSVDMPTDTLEMLEAIAVESSGIPLAMIQSESDVEFSRTYTTLNLKVMREALDYQIDLNPAIENFLKMILIAEKNGYDEIDTIKALDITLQSPMILLINNLLENLSNAKEVAGNINEIVYGSSQEQDGRTDAFILEICKRYTPNIPWDDFIDIRKSIDMLFNSKKAGDADDEAATDGDINNI